MKVSLSVVFITKNEEFHIGDAIDNVSDVAEEVFVVDSGSTDKTVAIAEAHGAKVLYHPFEDFGKQWNWALEHCPIRTAWTMKMDPDERVSEGLKSDIREALATDRKDVGFSFDRVYWFMGRRLRGVASEVSRIWRTGRCRFTDISVNEHPLLDGEWMKLRGVMEHLDSRNLTDWFAKQNDYSLREAVQRCHGEQLPVRPKFFGSRLERRMFLKWLYRRLPMRYLVENFYNFFWRGAWKSGAVGWRWVKCREMVSRMAEYKYFEMETVRRKMPIDE